MSQKTFILPVRIYYEDTDFTGMVYHSRYLNIMERARTEMLRECGFELDHLYQEFGLSFVVRKATLHFKKPAQFNDLITVETYLSHTGKVKMDFSQTIFKNDTILCTGEVGIACINTERKPHRIPNSLLEKMR